MCSSLNPANSRDRREWLGIASRSTNQKAIDQKAILSELQNNYPRLWERLKNPDYNFAGLFIGPAYDSVELALIESLFRSRETSQNLEFFAQNISPLMREEFLSRAVEKRLTDLIKTYDLYRFEDSRYQPPLCDLLISYNSWAYVSAWRNESVSTNALIKFVDLLKPDSVGLIALQSNESDPFLLLSDYLSIENTYGESSSENVVDELERLGLPYRITTSEASTDITSCFKEGIFSPSAEGKMLLSFWLRICFDDINAKDQTQIGNKLTRLVKKNGEEKLILRNTFIWLSTD